MARLLGERVGETVGYRVRLESRVGPRTRVEVVTEGILTRMMQHDPTLDGVAAVLFDEFHERHLTADLGLALVLESRSVLRGDLRVLVMSATLEAAPVAALLGAGATRGDATVTDAGADRPGHTDPAPVIVSEGRQFPVETRWRPLRPGIPPALGVAHAVREVCASADGDVLVFLPGIADLHRVRRALEESPPVGAPEVLLLHGGLTLDEQDHVLRAGSKRRRVILSTAIAESSVTLERVRVVVDAGLARVPRYSPRSGMTRLATTRVSRASADQRRGRAGRDAAGLCVRLWSEGDQAQLLERAVPEILEADLTPLALELACAGLADAGRLRWLDAPPTGALRQGRALLTELGALDALGRVTTHGHTMAALGIAPRLAHLVIAGAAAGHAALACEVAALLAERDVVRREVAEQDADLRARVELVRGRGRTGDADRARLGHVKQEARALLRALPREVVSPAARGATDATDATRTADVDDTVHVGALVALAFPDRVAQRRPGSAPRFLLRNGRGARLDTPQSIGDSPYLAIADLDGDPGESRIRLAAPLDEAALRAAVGDALEREQRVSWDDATASIRAVERERIGALVLRERPLRDIPPGHIAAALLDHVRSLGIGALPWSDAATKLRARLLFAHRHVPELYPDVSDDALLTRLDHWLGPALAEARRWSDVERADLGAALLAQLDWNARARLDVLAPTHVEVPSGSRIGVDYSDPGAPVLAVRLQEVFGWRETPRVADGRVPLTLHLLSPAHRPVQVTRDLANFWRTTYFDVRRDLKGRYPRHPWPDDPLSAAPTRRAKPRGT
jgi:ATP-dependent helicase HrpB